MSDKPPAVRVRSGNTQQSGVAPRKPASSAGALISNWKSWDLTPIFSSARTEAIAWMASVRGLDRSDSQVESPGG